jgi:hypothetical protein
MNDAKRWRLDMLLDLLADEVAERLRARLEFQRPEPEPPEDVAPIVAVSSAPEVTEAPASEPAQTPPEPASESVPTLAGSFSPHAAALMARLALGVFIIVVLINIPLDIQGTALARSIPSSASLIIRNGLIVKEATSPDICREPRILETIYKREPIVRSTQMYQQPAFLSARSGAQTVDCGYPYLRGGRLCVAGYQGCSLRIPTKSARWGDHSAGAWVAAASSAMSGQRAIAAKTWRRPNR